MVNCINKISRLIKGSKRELKVLNGVTGLSGAKLVGFLQRACNVNLDSDTCYLEIGVFQGLTLTSAAAVTKEECYGIDNFAQFDKDKVNQSIVEDRLQRHTTGNATLINADFEDALLNLPEYIGDKKIAVYFIDGPHDYRSQYLCLDFARPHLSDNVVIIIDDSNYEHVRQSTADWLKANPEFALLYEAYTACHPKNMDAEEEAKARSGWWNGVNIIVRDQENTLSRIYPHVNKDRSRYVNDHIIHSAKYADTAPKLLTAFSSILPIALLKVITLYLFSRKSDAQFAAMNTYSDRLTPDSFTVPIDNEGYTNE